MAISFASASSQRIERNDILGLTAYPFSLACWFKPSGFSVNHMLMTFGDHTVDNEFFRMYMDSTNLRFDAAGGGTIDTASATGAPTDGAWHHCAAVALNATSRSVFINGGGKATTTGSRDPFAVGLTRFAIGRSVQASPQYANGSVAEAAVWNVALSDREVASLSKAFCPLMIRPSALVGYWRLLRDVNGTVHIDRWRGDYNLTEGGTGSPTQVDHPRMIYPCGPTNC